MKTKNSFLCGAALFAGAALFSVQAQLTLSGTNYTQNFDTISNGLPAGWSVRINATTNSLGIVTNFNPAKKTWSDTTGEFGNCASTVANSGTNFTGSESTTVQGNCTNRALAIRQTGSFGDPGAAFGLQISNTIGMSNLTFSVDLCTLSTNNSRVTTWTIQYSVGDSPNSFTTLGSYTNSTNFSATNKTYNLGADSCGSPSNVWIRIVTLSPSVGSGNRATFGIDNFSLSWTPNGVLVVQPSITGIILTNGNVQIDFTGDAGDGPSAFKLQCVGRCSDVFGDTGATITQTSPGHFRAVYPMSGSQQFYRIKRP
jgi:hypothetical protein